VRLKAVAKVLFGAAVVEPGQWMGVPERQAASVEKNREVI
jgi:hypothetical protein